MLGLSYPKEPRVEEPQNHSQKGLFTALPDMGLVNVIQVAVS